MVIFQRSLCDRLPEGIKLEHPHEFHKKGRLIELFLFGGGEKKETHISSHEKKHQKVGEWNQGNCPHQDPTDSNFLGTPGEDYFKGNPKSLNFYFLVIWWGKEIIWPFFVFGGSLKATHGGHRWIHPTSFHVFFLPHFEASGNFSACHFKEICENSRNGPHVHPFSALSGAYYVDCGQLDQRWKNVRLVGGGAAWLFLNSTCSQLFRVWNNKKHMQLQKANNNRHIWDVVFDDLHA